MPKKADPLRGKKLQTVVSPQLAWSDFHIVYTVARFGSVAAACRPLNMTHSTLLRKLDGIESHIQTRLFERVRGRYSLTPAGHEIEAAARTFLPLAVAAESRAKGQDLRPAGEVRVSVAPILIQSILPPVLAQFSAAFPDVQIEISGSREHVSIRRREADVAIRVSDTVPDWLIARHLTDADFKVYRRRRNSRAIAPRSIDEIVSEHRWIGFEQDARDLKFDRWLASSVPGECVTMRVDNFANALALVKGGLGIALLPAFLEGTEKEIEPLTHPIPELRTPLWMITHPEIKNTARIRVFMRAIAPALASAVERAQKGRS